MNNIVNMPGKVIFIYSHDDKIRFGFHVWSAARIDVEFLAFFNPGDTKLSEIGQGTLDELKETGKCDFEDGWLRLFTDPVDAVAFMYEAAVEQYDGMVFEDKRRFDEMERAKKAEKELKQLRDTLRDALGPKATDAIRQTVA